MQQQLQDILDVLDILALLGLLGLRQRADRKPKAAIAPLKVRVLGAIDKQAGALLVVVTEVRQELFRHAVCRRHVYNFAPQWEPGSRGAVLPFGGADAQRVPELTSNQKEPWPHRPGY